MIAEPKRLWPTPTVHFSAILHATDLAEYTEIGDNCAIENSKLGAYSYCGPFCIIQNADIGKFSNIAAAVRIGATRHHMERASLHHFTYRSAMYGMDTFDDDEFFAERRARVTEIGHDTWLGHGTIVLPGVRIGLGAVIGAGSVVTKDVPDYTIAVGNPARVIKERFPLDVADALRAIAWWDWSHARLSAALPDFRGDVEAFIEKYAPVAAAWNSR